MRNSVRPNSIGRATIIAPPTITGDEYYRVVAGRITPDTFNLWHQAAVIRKRNPNDRKGAIYDLTACTSQMAPSPEPLLTSWRSSDKVDLCTEVVEKVRIALKGKFHPGGFVVNPNMEYCGMFLFGFLTDCEQAPHETLPILFDLPRKFDPKASITDKELNEMPAKSHGEHAVIAAITGCHRVVYIIIRGRNVHRHFISVLETKEMERALTSLSDLNKQFPAYRLLQQDDANRDRATMTAATCMSYILNR